jgi:predicted metalloprotease
VWAHYVNTKLRGKVELDPGDYEEAIRAAQAVGDDVLQRRSNGAVVPEKFTHGSAQQRSKWFRLGFESGDPKKHDPFVEEK